MIRLPAGRRPQTIDEETPGERVRFSCCTPASVQTDSTAVRTHARCPRLGWDKEEPSLGRGACALLLLLQGDGAILMRRHVI
jgi:hypothetical protein